MSRAILTANSKSDIPEYQIAVLGTTGVGKTSIIRRYTKEEFNPNYTPNLLENIYYKFQYRNKTGILKILDPIGIDDFESLFDQYIEVSKGFLVLYSIDDITSLEKARKILDKIKISKGGKSMNTVLVGNKIDYDKKKRMISFKEGEKWAEEYQCSFFETSCSTGKNVYQSFDSLIMLLNKEEGVSENFDKVEYRADEGPERNVVIIILVICLIVLFGVGVTIMLISMQK